MHFTQCDVKSTGAIEQKRVTLSFCMAFTTKLLASNLCNDLITYWKREFFRYMQSDWQGRSFFHER